MPLRVRDAWLARHFATSATGCPRSEQSRVIPFEMAHSRKEFLESYSMHAWQWSLGWLQKIDSNEKRLPTCFCLSATCLYHHLHGTRTQSANMEWVASMHRTHGSSIFFSITAAQEDCTRLACVWCFFSKYAAPAKVRPEFRFVFSVCLLRLSCSLQAQHADWLNSGMISHWVPLDWVPMKIPSGYMVSFPSEET